MATRYYETTRAALRSLPPWVVAFAIPLIVPLAAFALPLVGLLAAPLALAWLVSRRGRDASTSTIEAKAPTPAKGDGKKKAAMKDAPLPAAKPKSEVAGGAMPAPRLTGSAALLQQMRAKRAAAKADAEEVGTAVCVAYASQTGTAHEIAKALHAELASRIPAKRCSLVDFNDVDLSSPAPIVAFVAASTGDGDPPDNTASFYARMLRTKGRPLEGVKYTCLGLGDSNYTRFMAVPRAIRKKFEAFGAEALYWNAEADEVDGIEETVDKWTEGAIAAIFKEHEAKAKAKASSAAGEGAGGKGGGLQNGTHANGDAEVGIPPLPIRRHAFKWFDPKDGAAESAGGGHADLWAASSENNVGDEGAYTAQTPFMASVVGAERVTPEGYDKELFHIELGLEGSGLHYKPGDAFGVLPENAPGMVDGILTRLGIDGGLAFESAAFTAPRGIAARCTVRRALLSCCDITGPAKKSFLRVMAEACGGKEDRAKLLALIASTPEGRAAYKQGILGAQPTLLEMLEAHPTCKISARDLLEFLPPLAPRLYSVSSAPEAQGQKKAFHFAFSVVRFEPAPGRERRGVATAWLADLATRGVGGPALVPIFPRPSRDFAHPKDLAAPMVMVGPGTGVSPFRGFLLRRRAMVAAAIASGALPDKVGAAVLYFGCRDERMDYLYRTDLEALRDDGTLASLRVAFSRMQTHKVYVQHRMQEDAERLATLLLDEGAFVFVCGDGASMAKDVHTCLRGVIKERKGCPEDDAEAFLRQMQQDGKYVRDIWS